MPYRGAGENTPSCVPPQEGRAWKLLCYHLVIAEQVPLEDDGELGTMVFPSPFRKAKGGCHWGRVRNRAMDKMRTIKTTLKTIHSGREEGFTLVELMIVVAIVAILGAVATPAYINYINRVKQSEATSQLLTARIEMEEFYSDHNAYPTAIGCLPTFKGNDACLADCSSCTVTSYKNTSGACDGKGCYTYRLVGVPTASYYKIAATRKIYSYAQADEVIIESTSQVPAVSNTDALKFSVYKWLLE